MTFAIYNFVKIKRLTNPYRSSPCSGSASFEPIMGSVVNHGNDARKSELVRKKGLGLSFSESKPEFGFGLIEPSPSTCIESFDDIVTMPGSELAVAFISMSLYSCIDCIIVSRRSTVFLANDKLFFFFLKFC